MTSGRLERDHSDRERLSGPSVGAACPHEWAEQTLAGEYRVFHLIIADRREPDGYERAPVVDLRE